MGGKQRAAGADMPSPSQVRPESGRIELLLRRDGPEEARKWVERTAGLYREALGQRGSYAADPIYRPVFEKAVREFEEWLVTGQAGRAPRTGATP